MSSKCYSLGIIVGFLFMSQAIFQSKFSVNNDAVPSLASDFCIKLVRSLIQCGLECLKQDQCTGAIFVQGHGRRHSCALLSIYTSNESKSDGQAFLKKLSGITFRQFGPTMEMNRVPYIYLNILIEDPIGVNGTLIGVQYYATTIGTFYLGGWRQMTPGSTLIDKMWQVQVKSSSSRMNLQSVTETEVKAGDFLGVFYESTATQGVFFYEVENRTPVFINRTDPRLQTACNGRLYVDGDNFIFDRNTCSYQRTAFALELIIRE